MFMVVGARVFWAVIVLGVSGVVRFEVGAGIEKKQENFAEEVAAAVRGS